MIARLTGKIGRAAAGFVVVDVNGVGYKVNVPLSVLERLPEAGTDTVVTLEIETLVREDDISLYGFLDATDMQAFTLLLTVSGVGPKAALAMLSVLTTAQLAQAIAGDEVRTITRVPGIGPKTAQRIGLELKEKFAALGLTSALEKLGTGGATRPQEAAPSVIDDVVSALMNLGYNKAEAQRATDAAYKEKKEKMEGAEPRFNDLFRAALNRLTKA